MSAPQILEQLMGNWSGSNRLWLDPNDAVRESEAKATVGLAAKGRFALVQYTWADAGQPQEGLLLIGVDEPAGQAQGLWIDSWHMGDMWMICQGQIDAGGNLAITGSYAAPSGPDWNWRIEIHSNATDAFELRMFNITPEGDAMLAVQATYRRA